MLLLFVVQIYVLKGTDARKRDLKKTGLLFCLFLYVRAIDFGQNIASVSSCFFFALASIVYWLSRRDG